MLILFRSKSRIMCRQLPGKHCPEVNYDLKPVFFCICDNAMATAEPAQNALKPGAGTRMVGTRRTAKWQTARSLVSLTHFNIARNSMWEALPLPPAR